MSGAPRALVSIGTNSTRLLIVGDDDVTLSVDSRGTRLGAGLQHTGHLDAAARERTLAAIDDYLATVREHNARVVCIATSAMRRATDGAAFAEELARRIGGPPHILSGEEEAAYSFLGATAQRADDDAVGVLDVGGGSSELAVDIPARARRTGRVAFTESVEIGAVRLAERHPALLGERALDVDARSTAIDAARRDARAVLAPYTAAPRPARLIAVGGTAFAAAAMIAGATLHDGASMSHDQRAQLIDALLGRSLEQRRAMPFIRPQRADILPAGLIVVDEACALLDIDTVSVSIDDLLAGYLRSPAYGKRSRGDAEFD